MGRGIVHPTDAMQSEPWNADLLDFLAEHLVESGYDLKATLRLIATSQAYQSRVERIADDSDVHGYRYAGPRSKRLTAEQFLDCVWQLTGTAPAKYDAPVVRGQSDADQAKSAPVTAAWIWSRAEVRDVPAGETVALRKEWKCDPAPEQMIAVVSCDNEYTLYVNGRRVHAGTNWEAPDLVPLSNLQAGTNEILIVAKNGGNGPNPAGLFFEARWTGPGDASGSLISDESWQWSARLPDKNGKYRKPPEDWQAAARVNAPEVWSRRLDSEIALLFSRGASASQLMVRASLLKSDFLMRSLGRPNRDQIVSVRPLELTTLEAIDLSNGETLAAFLRQGAVNLLAREWQSPEDLIRWVYEFALSREPTAAERESMLEMMGSGLDPARVEDLLWAVLMLPEFQIVR
jgi:hypothetical protein